MASTRRGPTNDDFVAGIESGDRTLLSRAITLIESSRDDHAEAAQQILRQLLPRTGAATRVGISGVPGVGKSTFIDALGTRLTAAGHRVAVLAVDPSSQLTGGSVLGDKTRMGQLAQNPAAYIRPSPGGDAHGGVARRTREAGLLCEAAGYDVLLIETIGVGQAEVAVSNMVDTFVLLALAGAGDELQGIKRGIMELADVLVIHKADGETLPHAERARTDYTAAQHLLHQNRPDWLPPVLLASSLTGDGIDEVWQAVLQHRANSGTEGLATRRREQAVCWFDAAVEELLQREFFTDPRVAAALPEIRRQVTAGSMHPTAAAHALVAARGV